MSILQNWLLLSVIAGLGSNLFNFLSRFILRDDDNDPTAFAWYYESLRLIAFFGIAGLFDWKIIFTQTSIILFVLLGITEWLAVYWFMKMHQHTHLSISSILSRTRLLWVPVIGFFILGSRLTLYDYIGICVLFAGLTIIVAPNKILIDKGARFANFSAFMVAFNIVLTKMALPYASNSIVNAVVTIPPVLFFPFFMKDAKIRITHMFKKNLLLKTFAVIVNIFYIYVFTQALRVGDPSKATAIYQGMLVFSILAGILFLKEREGIKRKLLGALVTVIGVVILSFT